MEPVFVAAAAAVVGKVSEALVEEAKELLPRLRKALRRAFGGSDEAQEALTAAQDDPDDDQAVAELARHIQSAADRDSEVRALLDRLRPESADGTHTNVVQGSADVVVQVGRDSHGGISINRGQ